MSKKDFEERLSVCYPYVRELYERYEHIFSDDLVSLSWYPGWSHVVEGILRSFEENNRTSDKKQTIVQIKSHFCSLYVHYYGSGKKFDKLLKSADIACQCSCRACGHLIKMGDVYCEQCR